MLKKFLLTICLIIALLTQELSLNAAEGTNQDKNEEVNLGLYATGAVLMDGDSGRVLYEKNASEIMPMASTTKIMTCIVALENGNTEDIVTISKKAAGQPKVHLGMIKEEHYRLKDLLYSLMLESHNDSAVAIAEHVGGSIEGFAGMMNQKARDLSCFDTYFITPNGLDSTAKVKADSGEEIEKAHSTTAKDLARIMKYCIKESEKRDEFLEITRTQSYSFNNMTEDGGNGYKAGSRSFSCTNHNAFLSMMDGALSGKTGFTNKAGYCYVGALERDGKTFIVALLACGWPNNKSYKWSDTKQLMNYGLENYNYRNVWKEVKLNPISVKEGVPDSGNLADNSFTDIAIKESNEEVMTRELNVLLKENEEVEVKAELEKELTAPVNAGDIVGSIKYYLEGKVISAYTIIAKKSIKKIDYKWCLEKIIKNYFLIIS